MKTFYAMERRLNLYPILQVVLISICVSCARYKTNYSAEGEKWINEKPAANLSLKHKMYLVGDAGNSMTPDTVPVLKYLRDNLANETENSSIFFLGDNIYPKGMPPRGNSERVAAEYSISTQLDALRQFKGYPIVIPGNHDWKLDKEFVGEQRKFVQHFLDSTRKTSDVNYFLPSNGNIGPVAVELNNNIVAIIIDSHQLIKRWKIKSNGKTNGERFKVELDSMLATYKSKNVILAMHHPVYSYGPHGGHLSLLQHIVPGTEYNPFIILPLPGIGWFFRRVVGIPQDVHSRKSNRLRKVLFSVMENNKKLTFVTGHEHTLQYIERDNQNFVISGSGSKTSPVGVGKGTLFSSATIGFSTLSFYEGNETWVTFYHVSKDGKRADIVFQKRILEKSL
jgi:hypothetical protein